MGILRRLRIRWAANHLLVSLRALRAELDHVLADAFTDAIHRRLRVFAGAVISDLEHHHFEASDAESALERLSALGTDLTLHRTLARWESATTLNGCIEQAERRAAHLRSVLRPAA